MRIIQSFWGGSNKNVTYAYGWADYRYHWLGWMLSCFQLRKYYDQVELYTDEFGYDVLIKKLQLPYTKVHVVLEDLNNLPNDLWAMAKIKTYSLQDEPFLHVDGDVFIFEPFPLDLLKSDLIAQNKEFATEYYQTRWSAIYSTLTYMPNIMSNFHNGIDKFAYNMGIIGGNDISFFKEYCNISHEFVHNNAAVWDKINLLNFNIFFEQVLFNACVNVSKKKVNILIKEDIGDNEYFGFGEFDDVPHKRTFLHLLGVYKQSNFVCSKMLQYCWYNHPDWIKKLFSEINPGHQNFNNLKFTKNENDELIEWYRNNIEGEEKTIKRLIARDLFNYEQVRLIEKLEEENRDYKIKLLPEIIIGKTNNGGYNLSIKEIIRNSFIADLEKIDELIIYELNNPKLKSALINSILNRLKDNISNDEEHVLRKYINTLLEQFVRTKTIAISTT